MKHVYLSVFACLALKAFSCLPPAETTGFHTDIFTIEHIQVGTDDFANEVGNTNLYKNIIVYFAKGDSGLVYACPEGDVNQSRQTAFLIENSDQETGNYLTSLAAFQEKKSIEVTYQCVQLTRTKDGVDEINDNFAVIKSLKFIVP